MTFRNLKLGRAQRLVGLLADPEIAGVLTRHHNRLPAMAEQWDKESHYERSWKRERKKRYRS